MEHINDVLEILEEYAELNKKVAAKNRQLELWDSGDYHSGLSQGLQSAVNMIRWYQTTLRYKG